MGLSVVSVLIIGAAIRLWQGWAMTQRRRRRDADRESGTPGHPARGRYLSWQVSWLADDRSRPSSRDKPSDKNGRSLAAYSCGGSSGI